MANSNSAKQPPTFKMGGPVGVILYAGFFTAYTYFITLKCQTGDWDIFSWPANVAALSMYSTSVLIKVLLWFLMQCLLYVVPLGGPVEKGVQLQSGQQLTYRANALLVLFLNIGGLVAAYSMSYDVALLNKSLLPMLTACILLCLVFSVYLYTRGGRAQPEQRNPCGNTGNAVYDWFMGRELNPRWGGTLDVKYVLFRSGIIGWTLLNLCSFIENLAHDHAINANLAILNLIQLWYVVDYFFLERGVIVSRDIVSEGLGYNIMVQFVMIPFCFCVQTRYVLTMEFHSSPLHLLTTVVLYGLGYYIYRASNSEKNNFRKNPNDPKLAHLKTMTTSAGKSLLISGWWGMCRHPNHLGDIFISLSYTLCTGFSHVVPYLGTVFLVLLLLDREKHDNEDCKRKYGQDWEKYCNIVKYRIIPGIY